MTSTVRWRAWKVRQERGEILLDVLVDYTLIELMLDAGVIDEAGSRDREQLASVLKQLATNALAARGKSEVRIF